VETAENQGEGCGRSAGRETKVTSVPVPLRHRPTRNRDVHEVYYIGSAGRIRTYDHPINSRTLYH
jgi:hypothetical protein